jgi:outer membrane receptor protein involved in Fe transport
LQKLFRMKFACYLFVSLFFINVSLAQTGKITGKVITASSGEPLLGATLTLIEKSTTKISDQNGVFSFAKLAAGTYSIKCTYSGFEEKIIEEIIVKENDNTDINISLTVKTTDAVVIKAPKRVKAAGATVESLLIAQKNAANVSDGVTEQTIKKTPDSKGSDVIKRVSGASIQDDKFAVIRGLNDRYNASFINGAPLPSTESDRKAFAFDIFPSAILENLIIYKTASPDKPGEFAGGIIDITTKSTSAKPIGQITIGQGFNSLITGEKRLFNEMKGKKDWLGLDDGGRALPDGLPDQNGVNSLTPDGKLDLAKRFGKYKWGVKSAVTKPNFNFQLIKSVNINRKDQEFISTLFSITYNRSFTFVTGERNTFTNPDYTADPSSQAYSPQYIRKAIDSVYNDEIIWGALANMSVKINNRNSISWKNNLSVNTDNRLAKRIGYVDLVSGDSTIVGETLSQFISDKIYSSQLIGEHQIGKFKTKVNWLGAYSKVAREMPNQLLVGPGIATGGIGARGASGGMISTNSQEAIRSGKIDITQPYTFMKNSQNFIKIGGGYQIRKRNFGTRDMNFIQYGGTSYEMDFSVINLPGDQRFLEQYLGPLANGKAAIAVQDGTVPNSSYIASSANTFAYVMNDQRFFKKFRLIAGVRLESFNQKISTPRRGLNEVNIDFTKVDFLPSANLVYAITPKTNLRASYSETVNRPEFRELAPFGFYEFISDLYVFGEQSLVRAKINNYDLRYEIYPGKAQLFSFSAFYKKFTNPIEFRLSDQYLSEAFYKNTESATLIGAEAEFRILLSTLFDRKNEKGILSKLTLAGNGALMKSKVPLGLDKDSVTKLSRPLQGQSPYIINASLAYNDDKTGLSSTISLNRVGEKLAIVGSKIRPEIFDIARTVIDFQIAKTFFSNKVEVKFNIRDLLAKNITNYYDFDKSRSFTEKDRIFFSNVSPRVFSFTTSIKF